MGVSGYLGGLHAKQYYPGRCPNRRHVHPPTLTPTFRVNLCVDRAPRQPVIHPAERAPRFLAYRSRWMVEQRHEQRRHVRGDFGQRPHCVMRVVSDAWITREQPLGEQVDQPRPRVGVHPPQRPRGAWRERLRLFDKRPERPDEFRSLRVDARADGRCIFATPGGPPQRGQRLDGRPVPGALYIVRERGSDLRGVVRVDTEEGCRGRYADTVLSVVEVCHKLGNPTGSIWAVVAKGRGGGPSQALVRVV